jgi:hypothetical protein
VATYESWGSPQRRDLAIAIRDAGGLGLTPTQLARITQRRPQNLTAGLSALTAAGMLSRSSNSPRPANQTGHWPRYRYALTPNGIAALAASTAAPAAATTSRRAPLDSSAASGLLKPGDNIVWIEMAAALPEIWHVLADAEVVGRACWTAVSDGQPQEYAVTFRGQTAVADSIELMTLLAAARIPARRAAVTSVAGANSLREDARRHANAVRRTRLARDTREAS